MIDATEAAQQARALYDAHGDKAEAEIAHKAREAQERGDTDTAEDWNKIRTALKELRGPRMT